MFLLLNHLDMTSTGYGQQGRRAVTFVGLERPGGVAGGWRVAGGSLVACLLLQCCCLLAPWRGRPPAGAARAWRAWPGTWDGGLRQRHDARPRRRDGETGGGAGRPATAPARRSHVPVPSRRHLPRLLLLGQWAWKVGIGIVGRIVSLFILGFFWMSRPFFFFIFLLKNP